MAGEAVAQKCRGTHGGHDRAVLEPALELVLELQLELVGPAGSSVELLLQ